MYRGNLNLKIMSHRGRHGVTLGGVSGVPVTRRDNHSSRVITSVSIVTLVVAGRPGAEADTEVITQH